MEAADITAIAVAVIITAAELFCLFICSRLKQESYPIYAAVPVSSRDKELPQRLEFLRSVIDNGSPVIGSVIIIYIDGDEEQLKLCREFCRCVPCAELILPAEIEKTLEKHLHFN